MTDPNRNDSFVAVNIVNAVRHDFAFLGSRKSCVSVSRGWPWARILARYCSYCRAFPSSSCRRRGRAPPAFPGFTRALICSNCALRSGVVAFTRFPITLEAIAQLPQQLRTVDPPTSKPWLRRSTVRMRVLLQVQRSGLVGSPRVVGEINCSRAVSNSGCSSCRERRPAPSRR